MHEAPTIQKDRALSDNERERVETAMTQMIRWVERGEESDESLDDAVLYLIQNYDDKTLTKATNIVDFSHDHRLKVRWFRFINELMPRLIRGEPTVSGIRSKIPSNPELKADSAERAGWREVIPELLTPEQHEEHTAIKTFILACEEVMFKRDMSLEDRERILLRLWSMARNPTETKSLIEQASLVAPLPWEDLRKLSLVQALPKLDTQAFVDALDLLADDIEEQKEKTPTEAAAA